MQKTRPGETRTRILALLRACRDLGMDPLDGPSLARMFGCTERNIAIQIRTLEAEGLAHHVQGYSATASDALPRIAIPREELVSQALRSGERPVPEDAPFRDAVTSCYRYGARLVLEYA